VIYRVLLKGGREMEGEFLTDDEFYLFGCECSFCKGREEEVKALELVELKIMED